MKYLLLNPGKLLLMLMATGVLASCSLDFGDDDDNDEPEPVVNQVYQISIQNLTQSQPLSPPGIFTHSTEYKLWAAGEMASVALEVLAEGGDASMLDDLDIVMQSQLAEMPVAPGENMSWTFEIEQGSTEALSIATMLVNTNDAFTGVTAMPLANMGVGEVHQQYLQAYDAGTEMNDESALPGPAASAEGFNASRSGDVNRVYLHAGVLTQYELSGSVLMPEHKFDNPVAKLMVKRLQ